MKYSIGLVLAFTGFFLASQHLKQEISEYWDFVAFFVVIFGTLAVMIISAPAVSLKFIMRTLWKKFSSKGEGLKVTAATCREFFLQSEIAKENNSIEASLLRDGQELISLGFSQEKVRDVLAQRFHHHNRKLALISGWLKRNSKYPPAFGLAGTVLGLIHLMRGISSGIDTKETGLRMAVALVATFYGLLISNLVLNPIGEWLGEEIKREEVKAEMAIDTVMAIMSQSNVVEFQELLNSYLEADERIDLVSFDLQRNAA